MSLAAALLAAAWGELVNEASRSEADVAQIRALTREFVLGFNSGDLDRLMSFYAHDMEVWRRFPQGWKSIWSIDAEVYPEPK